MTTNIELAQQIESLRQNMTQAFENAHDGLSIIQSRIDVEHHALVQHIEAVAGQAVRAREDIGRRLDDLAMFIGARPAVPPIEQRHRQQIAKNANALFDTLYGQNGVAN